MEEDFKETIQSINIIASSGNMSMYPYPILYTHTHIFFL